MADKEVKVFSFWQSPFSGRVEIALRMKGVEYEIVKEDRLNKSPLLVKYNPVHKKVPVLLHNGKPIAESLVILEYIDETWISGTPLLPTDPHEKAMARFWAKFIDDKCLGALLKVMRSKRDEQEEIIKEMDGYLRTLDNELESKKFFGGESIGFVDIVANLIACWLEVIPEAMDITMFEKNKYPNLSEWMDRYLNLTIIKESLPPRAELLAFYQSLFRPNSDSK